MILNAILALDNMPDSEIVELEGAEDLKPGEEVVGTVSIRAQKLNMLLGREHDNIMKEALETKKKGIANKQEYEEALARIAPIKGRADLLGMLFWKEVAEELGVSSATLAIRKGWQVVVVPEETKPETAEITFEVVRIPCDDPNCPSCRGGSIFGDANENPFGSQ